MLCVLLNQSPSKALSTRMPIVSFKGTLVNNAEIGDKDMVRLRVRLDTSVFNLVSKTKIIVDTIFIG